MTHRKSPLMKRTLLALAMLALAACNTPARIEAPDDKTVEDGKRALDQLAQLPPAVERIRIGDQLRIVRDAGEMPTLSAFNVSTIYELTLYTVQTDGKINYPFLGPIQVAGRQPSELATELTRKLAPTYREPRVTVNINQAPANSVIVGGAVNNPTAVQIATANTLEQAIVGAGGINPAATPAWSRCCAKTPRVPTARTFWTSANCSKPVPTGANRCGCNVAMWCSCPSPMWVNASRGWIPT